MLGIAPEARSAWSSSASVSRVRRTRSAARMRARLLAGAGRQGVEELAARRACRASGRRRACSGSRPNAPPSTARAAAAGCSRRSCCRRETSSSSRPPVRWRVDVDHVVLQPAVDRGLDAAPARRRSRAWYSLSESGVGTMVMSWLDRIDGCCERHSSVAARLAAARHRGALRLAASGLTVGCGQKGPLTLPRTAPAAASAPAPASAASTHTLVLIGLPCSPVPRTSPTAAGELFIEDCALDELARTLRHAAVRLLARRRCSTALAAYQRALAGRDHLICYAMKANSSLAVLQTFARAGCGFDIVSGGELERVLAAGGDAGQGRLLGRRQDARRDAPRARRRRAAASTSRARPSSSVLSQVAVAAGPSARRSACASTRTSTPRPTPTSPPGCKGNKFGIAHDQRARPPTGAPPRCRACEVVGIDCHIGSQITDDGALPRRAGPPARPGRGGRGARASPLAPPRPRRRPRHHLHRRAAAGGRCAGARAARAHRRARPRPPRSSCSSPAARWSATPACCVTEVLYLKPGEQKNFCIVDAAMNDLMRPAMYEAWMGIVPLHAARRAAADLGRRRPGLRIGRLARPRPRAGRAAGRPARRAVGRRLRMSMASNYNTRGRAPPR